MPKFPSDVIDQFRSVSVLLVVSKVLERLVKHQLSAFLEASDVLCENQAGLRPNYTTQDCSACFCRQLENGP